MVMSLQKAEAEDDADGAEESPEASLEEYLSIAYVLP